jgi:L-aminopeptidase/D-esterase-like protein
LLRPECSVERIHAIALCGGSAFGLDAAGGVMARLEEEGIGLPVMPGIRVPIVCAAVLFDLGIGSATVRPDAYMGRTACASAGKAFKQGMAGVGCGATVGKLSGIFSPGAAPARGGVGSASMRTCDGYIVGAIAAVNAAGDILHHETGEVLACGTLNGSPVYMKDALYAAGAYNSAFERALTGTNTTLAVVATNAVLSKAQAKRLAMSAHDGFARTIFPAHTPVDGDTAFALATCERDGEPPMIALCALAAEVTARAIVNAVTA